MICRPKTVQCLVTLIGMLSHAASGAELTTVRVGNSGNAPDTTTGRHYGGVQDDYRIGITEVSNAHYIEFLNSKASMSDVLGLYNVQMETSPYGGILRSGSGTTIDPYIYYAKDGKLSHPVNFVSWYDAIRFANWLHNEMGSGDTESGAYMLGQPLPNGEPVFGSITRHAGAKWFLPSINEWYKAAYHKNDGVTGNYWDYPVRSDGLPVAEAPPGEQQSANYDDFVDGPVDVASYIQARSAYGTFDQGGNVFEWVETTAPNVVDSTALVVGGNWESSAFLLSSSNPGNDSLKTNEFASRGFRVATNVPEPGSLMLTVCVLMVAACARVSGSAG